MAAEERPAPAPDSPFPAATKRRLGEALAPGRTTLVASAVLQTVAAAATAASFFALCAVAQEVLEGRATWAGAWPWLVMFAVAALVRASAGHLGARLASDGALTVERQLRARLLRRFLRGPGTALGSAAGATAVIDEVERIGAYAERYEPARITALLVPLVLLAAVFPLNWLVGALLLLCAPLPPLNLSIVGMGTASVARRHGEELRRQSGYFLDRLRGQSVLRALGAERDELARVEAAGERFAETSMEVLRVAFVSAAVLEAIVTAAISIVAIYVGLTLLGYFQVPGLPEQMSLRTGLFLLMVTPLYFQPVRSLAAAYHERAQALAAIEALRPSLEAASASHGRASRGGLARPPRVEVRGLTVAYPGRESAAVDHLSLSIEAGEMIGVGGASGAGKSTLLRVLAGDLEGWSGSVSLDGAGVGQVDRSAITWLGQRPYLFPGTLAENIALGRPDADPAEILDAALAVGLGGLVERLPRGLETPLAEAGWGISGGEAHRVAFARILLKGAPLLLLDEPTAHLDAASEAGIVEVIFRLARTATTIVAGHSPALLAACDRVVELDRGRLVEPSGLKLAA